MNSKYPLQIRLLFICHIESHWKCTYFCLGWTQSPCKIMKLYVTLQWGFLLALCVMDWCQILKFFFPVNVDIFVPGQSLSTLQRRLQLNILALCNVVSQNKWVWYENVCWASLVCMSWVFWWRLVPWSCVCGCALFPGAVSGRGYNTSLLFLETICNAI